ncbi:MULTISPECIES: hypothetical protein [unclassified Clostridioides]|uniref:hypothetical protein n=1 Tax=unclassified Clostridioides TaxID=2635829 RepID=UPI001D126034|nr:hypothetical protein [Clostridioides sp. ES-W-0018-02]MCC0713016.1 hypothetical protein [Clostridioides sp. ES-W-0017-02]
MKLFKIKVTHFAPKDMHNSIQEYVVSNNDREVFEYLANGYAHWKDIIENYNEVDIDTYKEALKIYEEIYNNKGDDRGVYDLYYGATQYSWEEVELVDDSVIELMIKNELAKNIKRCRDVKKN